MKRVIPLILAVSLLFSGCASLLDGSYHNTTPHKVDSTQTEEEIVSVSSYNGLRKTLSGMVESGTESGIISVAHYDQSHVDSDMKAVIKEIREENPIGAYALSEITYELGTYAGQSAVAVTLSYIHDRTEIGKIRHLKSWTEAQTAISGALDGCESGIVLYIEAYEEMDVAQWVANYAAANPDKVMELPEVATNVYPETGTERVVELKFTYQNSRDSLRAMQSKVRALFNAAVVYAGSDGDEADRFFKLYSFLMGLSPKFQMDTSITPAYSLLQHGVGDSRAFATVYAAMCGQAGLESITVTGTRAGEPWYWNIICCDGVYYHLDLLTCHQEDSFLFHTDEEMSGYVWDYSAYPACGVIPEPETEPTETTEETTEAAE